MLLSVFLFHVKQTAAVCTREIICVYFCFGRMQSVNIYRWSGSGIRMLPSAFRLFSRNAISILGGATTVLFRVWAKYLLPSAALTRMPSRLACASPKLEQLPISKYFFCLGDHASTSLLLTFRSARSPEHHSSVRTGISILRNSSTV